MDAPVGYLASIKNWAESSNIHFDDLINNKDTKLIHFIGKDIVYFHAIFWVTILHSINYRTPTKIFTHGFLKINGKKMSKSTKNFITTNSYIKVFNNVDYIRYYFASKLDYTINDIDLNLKDFMQKVNADLIGKIVNISSRTSKFINEYFNSSLFNVSNKNTLIIYFLKKQSLIDNYYENLEYKKVVQEILGLASKINKLIDDKKPWVLIKDKEKHSEVHQICSLCINLYRIILFYLEPIMPSFCCESRKHLNINDEDGSTIKETLSNHKIKKFKVILKRISKQQIENISQDM